MVKNLTKKQVESIQIDEGVIYIDYGEENEIYLAPTRGGGEFSATVTVRDIEFDGRHGKVKGMQTIEEQDATLKVTTIGLTQEVLALSFPGCTAESGGEQTVKNPASGLIPETAYRKNIVMFAKTIGGKYKKITIKNPMHEGGINVKAAQKAEGELALEFHAHYTTDKLDEAGELWEVQEVAEPPSPRGGV